MVISHDFLCTTGAMPVFGMPSAHTKMEPIRFLTCKLPYETPKFPVLCAKWAQAQSPTNAVGCLSCLGSGPGLGLDTLYSFSPLSGSQVPQR